MMTIRGLAQEFAIASKELAANNAAFLQVDHTKIDVCTQLKAVAALQRYQKATIEMNNITKEIILQDAIRKGLTGSE